MSVDESMRTAAPAIGARPAKSKLQVEQYGIRLLPEEARRGQARDLGWLWAGTNLNIETVVFGSFLPFLGLSFIQSVIITLVGSVTWLVVGYASLQGPAAGTSIFAISRAAFGVRGGRVVAFLSWMTQVMYETTGLAIVVLAALALLNREGIHASTGLKLTVIVIAALIQLVLPLLGHQYIVRVQRLLVVPFIVLFVILTALTWSKVSLHGHSGGLPAIFGGFALVFAGGSFAWVANASDYSRYLPTETPKHKIVWSVALGGYLSTVPLFILGEAIASIPSFAGNAVSGLPAAFPAWFVVPYLLFVIVQMYGINSVDLYSSSLSLQAAGVPLRQWQATLTDCACTAGLTAAVIFSTSFNTAIEDIILFLMIWVSPWCGVFLLDYFLRRGRYHHVGLFAHRSGPYWQRGGFRVAGLVSFIVGAVASALCIDTTLFVGPIAKAMNGTDLSIPMGFFVAAGAYWLLSRTDVSAEPHGEGLAAAVLAA